jgi:hypothetical protein
VDDKYSANDELGAEVIANIIGKYKKIDKKIVPLSKFLKHAYDQLEVEYSDSLNGLIKTFISRHYQDAYCFNNDDQKQNCSAHGAQYMANIITNFLCTLVDYIAANVWETEDNWTINRKKFMAALRTIGITLRSSLLNKNSLIIHDMNGYIELTYIEYKKDEEEAAKRRALKTDAPEKPTTGPKRPPKHQNATPRARSPPATNDSDNDSDNEEENEKNADEVNNESDNEESDSD